MRLHRRLPDVDMAQIGRQFVREEFHRHKSADPKFVTSFMKEWTVSRVHFLLKMRRNPIFTFQSLLPVDQFALLVIVRIKLPFYL